MLCTSCPVGGGGGGGVQDVESIGKVFNDTM